MASTPVPPVEIWHEHHNYPTGDLVLVSNDGVKFRTFKGLIVRSSQALNLMDTSTLISDTGEPDATMIRLDYPARIITTFLDTAPMSYFKFTTTSFDDAVSLLALAEKFEAQKLIARVIQYLPTATGERVADLLLLASARDDWAMGRTALAQFHGYRVKLIASRPGGFEGFFAELRPTWRQTLKDLVFFHSLEKKKLLYDWYDIRAKFIEPPPPPPSHPSPAPASPAVAADKRKSNEDPDAAQKRIKTEQAEQE